MSTRRRDRRPERGVTLVETMVALTLAVVVMATVMGTFISFSGAEQRQADAIDERQDMRRAIDEISRTVRSAWPLHRAPSTQDALTEVTFSVPDDGSGPTTRRLRFDPTRHEVILETLDDATSRNVVGQRLVLTGAAPSATPFIRYFTLDDRELIPGQQDPDTMATCTVRLRVTLGRPAIGTGAPLDMSTDAALRNLPAEAVAC